jgi:predicted RNA binding protein YcfA (HicA-like mRNA interferase family)
MKAVPLKVRDVIKELERAGWRHLGAKGDHRVFQQSDGRITVVSGHLGDGGGITILVSGRPAYLSRSTNDRTLIEDGQRRGEAQWKHRLPLASSRRTNLPKPRCYCESTFNTT